MSTSKHKLPLQSKVLLASIKKFVGARLVPRGFPAKTGEVSAMRLRPENSKEKNEMEKINPYAGKMPSLSYATKAPLPEQVAEVETIPSSISHSEMIAQSLGKTPGGPANGNGQPTVMPARSMEFPAKRQLPASEGGISHAELVERSKNLPATGGTPGEIE